MFHMCIWTGRKILIARVPPATHESGCLIRDRFSYFNMWLCLCLPCIRYNSCCRLFACVRRLSRIRGRQRGVARPTEITRDASLGIHDLTDGRTDGEPPADRPGKPPPQTQQEIGDMKTTGKERCVASQPPNERRISGAERTRTGGAAGSRDVAAM